MPPVGFVAGLLLAVLHCMTVAQPLDLCFKNGCYIIKVMHRECGVMLWLIRKQEEKRETKLILLGHPRIMLQRQGNEFIRQESFLRKDEHC